MKNQYLNTQENEILTKKTIEYSLGLIANWNEKIFKRIQKDNSYVTAIRMGESPEDIGILIDDTQKITFIPSEYTFHQEKLLRLFSTPLTHLLVGNTTILCNSVRWYSS